MDTQETIVDADNDTVMASQPTESVKHGRDMDDDDYDF
jgi:hypothetical protein